MDLMVSCTAEQVISVEISDRVKSLAIIVSFVYGLHSVQDRKAMWQDLRNVADVVRGKVVNYGGFQLTL